MARRRGFFAELQYQNQLAQKRQMQAERAASQAYARAVREEAQARKRAERAAAQASRAAAAEQKAAEREAKQLHLEARLAEVDSLNARLEGTLEDISSLLAWTLDFDDYVDLEELRVKAEHPPFQRSDLETPTPPPTLAEAPVEPVLVEPEPPKGLSGLFGKKKHAEAVSAAQAAYAAAHEKWKADAAAVPDRQLRQMQEHEAAERQRLESLQQARDSYQQESEEREAGASKANEALDDLIANLIRGVDSAIQEYVGIVLSNSVYPDAFPVEYDFTFESDLKELTLIAIVPPPSALPTVKQYRYVKAKDEITKTAMPKRDSKERYADAVYQVALRTLHEVFEADRAGHIQTIALTVATEANDPATGRHQRSHFVGVGADRDTFTTFDLHNIVPEATLQHLGASVSKSPFDLVSIDPVRGVRGTQA